ncbi:AraC family transcriptional regulator [Streptomyces winkii]|uniref:AraC family transcriptional regulator n=1 Tax=Streptomyces winkii TaxID=3051178 RepID=UPI0028D30D94|nr:AraC family transcriptional regulator [Streptomyces sp. DSM 40971]
MRAAFEHVGSTPPLSWKLFVRRERQFAFQWHFHHEFELTLITRGTGTRLVGDCVQDYGPGDLTLIGPDLPHTYVSTPGQDEQEAVVAQFRGDFLGDFLDRPEFAAVAGLLERAARGLVFPPSLVGLDELNGLGPAERTLELLRVLLRLSGCAHARPLAGARHVPVLDRAASERIDAMVGLMHAAYHRPLRLEEVADAAHMAPSSASRFFRRTTGTTITDYLNSLRVNAACHLLRDSGRRVADIAADCGYGNLSNFNRRFRELKGMAPRDYRNRFEASRGVGA